MNNYTPWIDEKTANRYLREDGGKWQIWPVQDIFDNAKRTVDIQDLKKIQDIRKTKDCEHKKKYIPDPSGNNDWYYECGKCGKDLGKKR